MRLNTRDRFERYQIIMLRLLGRIRDVFMSLRNGWVRVDICLDWVSYKEDTVFELSHTKVLWHSKAICL